MPQMKKEIKEKWIAALRSGEYSQCTGVLFNGHGFCCLGVLTDLYIKDTGYGEWTKDGFVDDVLLEGSYTELTPNVAVWAGMTSQGASVYGDEYNLAQLNDGDDAIDIDSHSFSEIANIIENGVEGV